MMAGHGIISRVASWSGVFRRGKSVVLAALWVFVGHVVAHGSAVEDPLIELHPNGERARYCGQKRLPSGELVLHGAFKRFAEDGTVLESGKYKLGRRNGSWTFRWENGQTRATGRFSAGVHKGTWKAWRADGTVDEALSGDYTPTTEESADWIGRGAVHDGLRHGEWRWDWRDGRPMLRAGYSLGEPAGDWFFFHPSGDPDPDFLSGYYDPEYADSPDGRRGPPEGRWPAAGEPLPLAELAPLAVRAVDQEAVAAEVRRFLESREEEFAFDAIVRSYGPACLPEVVNEFRTLADDPDHAADVVRLLGAMVRPLLGGRMTGVDADGPRLAVLRLYSYCRLLRSDPVGLSLELSRLRSGEEARLAPAHPGIQGPTAPIRPRSGLDAAAGPVIESALEWLAGHQHPDGSFRAEAFGLQCADAGAEPCDGVGRAQYDIGVTGLALLAFLGAPSDLRSRHEWTTVRGLVWLEKQQDRESGCFGHLGSYERVLYGHSLATQAICEAIALHRVGPRTLAAAQRSVDLIHRTRNPSAGWRYAYPANGASDVSMTGYMIQALTSAARVGLRVESAAQPEAVLYLDAMTDVDHWRTGYSGKGELSARYDESGDGWPAEKSEAMTASAMYSRILVGVDPKRSPVILGGADLLGKSLPRWDEEEGTIDFGYWTWGSHAMYAVGGSRWDRWQPKMLAAASAGQRKDGHARGSWDAQRDVFGWAGGRVYATAMMALALEAPIR